MKLRLINFRCYDDKTFDLGNSGLSLISGPSGIGKSTIFMAIYFALYGTGTKIISHGKTNCSVELEFDGMKIVRTKRPNRVVVNDTYEDDVAQNMINTKFGDCFNATGYIAQNAIGSFVLMSPIEKLEFLEKFAFKDVNLGKIKAKCKALITKSHDTLISTSSQLEMARKILAEQEQPEELKFPLKYPRILYNKATKDQEIRLKNAGVHHRRCARNIKSLNHELNSLNVLHATTKTKEEFLFFQKEKLSELHGVSNGLVSVDEKEIDKYRERLKSLICHRKFMSLQETYEDDMARLDEMKQNEMEKLSAEISQIEKDLWADFTIEDHAQYLSETEKFASDLETLDKLNVELSKYDGISRSDLEGARMKMDDLRSEYDNLNKIAEMIKIQGETYTCPCCMVKLRLREKSLCVLDNYKEITTDPNDTLERKKEIENEIQKLERHISDVEIKIHRRDEILRLIDEITQNYKGVKESILEVKSDIELLREYKNTQIRNEKRLLFLRDELKNEKFSASYVSFRNSLREKEKELNRLKTSEHINESMTEEELREKIATMEHSLNRRKEIRRNIANIEKDIDDCETTIENVRKEYIEKFEKIRDVCEVEQNISQKEQEQQEQERLVARYQETLDQIKLFYENEEKRKKYDDWCKKVGELSSQEQEERKKYESALMLKEKILEAESKAIFNIINSINAHTQNYLDCFFPDNPISISLMPFKETKKSVKPQINLNIEYKEMDCDVNMLSGGELSRVILAFTLALGEMFNTPFLLLDEATASLDQDLTNMVTKGIRENFSGKLVVVIAHQVVVGAFDRIICL